MQRSSPSRTAGVVSRDVTLAGATFTLSTPTLVRTAADEEAVIVSRRRLPEGLSPEAQSMAMDKILCGIASPVEWQSYYNSLWRLAFRFWSHLDPKHKVDLSDPKHPRVMGLTEGVAWAYEVLNDDDITEDERESLYLAMRIVSQEDALGNSLSGSTDPVATQAMEVLTTAAGQPSTTTS